MNKKLRNKVHAYFEEPFQFRKSKTVPDPNNPHLAHNNSGIVADLAFIFVDIRDSSRLQESYGLETACSIYKAFHEINVRYIEQFHGKIRAFDGDRVMGSLGLEGKRL